MRIDSPYSQTSHDIFDPTRQQSAEPVRGIAQEMAEQEQTAQAADHDGFGAPRTLSKEEQQRLLELERELTAQLCQDPEKMTEEQQRRIREIEQEMAEITGVKLPAGGIVAQAADWMQHGEDSKGKGSLSTQELLGMESDEVRQWRADRLAQGVEIPEPGQGLMQFIRQNAVQAYTQQAQGEALSKNNGLPASALLDTGTAGLG